MEKRNTREKNIIFVVVCVVNCREKKTENRSFIQLVFNKIIEAAGFEIFQLSLIKLFIDLKMWPFFDEPIPPFNGGNKCSNI